MRSFCRWVIIEPVHPHLRGEHPSPSRGAFQHYGSSPPAWGACSRAAGRVSGGRFIPTCVGSIQRPRFGSRAGPVHPHLRGEHSSVVGLINIKSGSSPPAWGALHGKGVFFRGARFIPTCVGSITVQLLRCKSRTVHPHLRGEHPGLTANRSAISGSSPPAWGASITQAELDEAFRFIPTCVGSIRTGFHFNRRAPVHPHLRGEHQPWT